LPELPGSRGPGDAATGEPGERHPAGAASSGHDGPPGADVSLALTLLATAMLTIGWRLAVRRRYQAHRWVQTTAVVLNAVVVVVWMIRSSW